MKSFSCSNNVDLVKGYISNILEPKISTITLLDFIDHIRIYSLYSNSISKLTFEHTESPAKQMLDHPEPIEAFDGSIL